MGRKKLTEIIIFVTITTGMAMLLQKDIKIQGIKLLTNPYTKREYTAWNDPDHKNRYEKAIKERNYKQFKREATMLLRGTYTDQMKEIGFRATSKFNVWYSTPTIIDVEGHSKAQKTYKIHEFINKWL